MLSENYSPPLTLHRTRNPQMRAARPGTKDMWKGGCWSWGNPREEGVSPQVCRAKRMQTEEGVIQHMEGDQEPSPEAGWGSSLQGLLSSVLILSTGDEVSLRKMMRVTDKCFY